MSVVEVLGAAGAARHAGVREHPGATSAMVLSFAALVRFVVGAVSVFLGGRFVG